MNDEMMMDMKSDDGMSMSPKRLAPTKLAPIPYGQFEIRALQWGRREGLSQNGGYIEAWPKNGTQCEWRLRVYEIVYDGEMEEDGQDCFIEDMQLLAPDTLEVRDEKSRRYRINLINRQVQVL